MVTEPIDERPIPKPVRPKFTDDPIGDPASPASAWNIANALTVFRFALVPVLARAGLGDLRRGLDHRSH
jgi:hypothetical protein